jgi:monovalent cation/hydrogen antiporter
VEYEMRHARLTAARAAEKHLANLHSQGLVSSYTYERLKPKLDESIESYADAVREVLRAVPKLESEEMDTTRREILRAQRSALIGLRQDGVISQEVLEELRAEVDAQLISVSAAEEVSLNVDQE